MRTATWHLVRRTELVEIHARSRADQTVDSPLRHRVSHDVQHDQDCSTHADDGQHETPRESCWWIHTVQVGVARARTGVRPRSRHITRVTSACCAARRKLQVVRGATRGLRQHTPCFCNPRDFHGGRRCSRVGVRFAHALAIGTTDVVERCGARYAEHGVVIGHVSTPVRRPPARRAALRWRTACSSW